MNDQGVPMVEEFRKTFSGAGFKTGFLKLAILKLVSEQPLHGYALMKEIERITEQSWRPSPGSIYPALQDLESSGLITLKVVGRKRVYEITPKGRVVLRHAIDHLQVALQSLQNLMEYKAP